MTVLTNVGVVEWKVVFVLGGDLTGTMTPVVDL